MLSYATTTKENACQIHKSCVATASSIIIGLQWSPTINWPFQGAW